MSTTQHDTGYKLLFSHPEMMRDLLTGYMPGAWLEQADFSTLYNGVTPWKAPTDVADCYGPSLPGLEPYRPQLLYHLVDEARLKLHPMQEMRNLAEALFRLERSRTPHDIAQVLRALGAVLQGPDMQPLRRTISIWVRMLLRRKAPRANIDELNNITDLLEANAMLEQTIERWFIEATSKGMNKGLQEGRQKGLQEGLQEGRQKGLAKAVALLIQMRFGAVPDWAQARLDDASEEQLTGWTAAILTAPTLQDMFGADGGTH